MKYEEMIRMIDGYLNEDNVQIDKQWVEILQTSRRLLQVEIDNKDERRTSHENICRN